MSPTERDDRITQLRQELDQTSKARSQSDDLAREARAMADAAETPQARHVAVLEAARHGGNSRALDRHWRELAQQIAALEAGPAPVVVTAEQAAAQDETYEYARTA